MTIPLDFKTLEPDAVKQFIHNELKRMSPHMKRMITAFYDLNWGEHNLEHSVLFTMPFLTGYFDGVGPLARVFEICLYTDTSELFSLQILEHSRGRETFIAEATLKFSDWRTPTQEAMI